MVVTDVREVVQELLKRLGQPGHNLKPLKDLFWTELNYGRGSDSLSCTSWPSSAKDPLAEDPILFASGGAQDDFHVIYCHLASASLSLGVEREVITQLLHNHPYTLFVFSNRDQTHWHFVNIKLDGQNANRRLYRRIAAGPQERLRTAAERLSMLNLGSIGGDLLGISPLAIQRKHDEAFDVEKVTGKFFDEYNSVFTRVEGLIDGIDDTDRKRLFTQRLFNRLMFIAFIEKKGWLRFGGDPNYLEKLWQAHATVSPADNFYETRLKRLFFSGLNRPGGSDPQYQHLIGETPYLNGGLFEEDGDSRDPAIVVPDEAIAAVLRDLFDHYNFTVTESTPLDVEVAVDPEMLGKVFEKLVTGRHESGSYYTPKPVVAFMGREAIKGYLGSSLQQETAEAIARFVDEHDPEGLKNPEAVLEALRRIKICDPACGSGAYVLGLLQELLELRASLFARTKVDAITVYERKLEVIQNNVYGVDIDPFAVNIARLRLWLSLAVDHDESSPLPLPNLDFKIERGDSLTAPNPAGYDFSSILGGGFAPQREDEQLQFVGMLPPKGVQLGFGDDQLLRYVDRYLEAKRDYLDAHADRKKELRAEIGRLKAELKELPRKGVTAMTGFDWLIEFLEVFIDGGFDIILANPPYVRADAQFKHIQDYQSRQNAIATWRDYRLIVSKSNIYQTLYQKWDLYIPFLERAFQLLRHGGHMAFIIPDAYNAAKYALKSHQFFLQETRIDRLDFCTDIPLFQAGVNNTILNYTKRAPAVADEPVRVRRKGDNPDDFDAHKRVLPSAPQATFGLALFRPDGERPGRQAAITLGMVCYISKGMVIHADERGHKGAFVTDDLISSVKDGRHPKPFIQGRDIAKWLPRRIQYLEWGTERAPAWFRRPTFPELYAVPEKFITMDIGGEILRVVYDTRHLLHNHSASSVVPWHYLHGVRNKSIQKTAKYSDELKPGETPHILREDLEKLARSFHPKYIVAIMNSAVARGFVNKRRKSKINIYPEDWKPLPIAPATEKEQGDVVELVDALLAELARYGAALPAAGGAVALERELDAHIARLYTRHGITLTDETNGGDD